MIEAIMTFLAAVGVLGLCFWTTKKIGKGAVHARQATYMKIVDQLALGQDRMLVTVQMSGKYFLLGVTPSQITLVRELKEEELLELPKSQETVSGEFAKLWEKIQKKELIRIKKVRDE